MDKQTKKSVKNQKRRHSKLCPCNEHIKIQTQYFSDLIKRLNGLNETEQNKILNSVDPCFIRFLGHCAQGILSSDIKLNKLGYQTLSPFKKSLIKIANPSLSIQKKRKELLKNQRGGFLGIVAGIVGAALAELVSKGIQKIWPNK